MAIIDPTVANVRARGHTKLRLLQVVIAAAAVFGAVGLTAAPASAEQTCMGSNLCLAINGLGNGTFAVHVGTDVHMSLEEAQEYVDDAGDPLFASIRGDDSGNVSQFLFSMPFTDVGASSESGLSADFDLAVPGSCRSSATGPRPATLRAGPATAGRLAWSYRRQPPSHTGTSSTSAGPPRTLRLCARREDLAGTVIVVVDGGGGSCPDQRVTPVLRRRLLPQLERPQLPTSAYPSPPPWRHQGVRRPIVRARARSPGLPGPMRSARQVRWAITV